MNEAGVSRCIRTKGIDSFQKLRVLMFFYQHPDLDLTYQQLAGELYLGSTLLLEDILSELQTSGLVDCTDNCCRLRKTPETNHCLGCLLEVFENPITRQRILDQVRSSLPSSYSLNR